MRRVIPGVLLAFLLAGCGEKVSVSAGSAKQEDSPGLALRQSPIFRSIRVSPQGNDANDGSSREKSVKTFSRALEIVRLHNVGMKGDIEVVFAAGTYEFPEPVRLQSRDSGYNGFKVIFRSEEDGVAIFSGGQAITQWEAAGTTADGRFSIFRAPLGFPSRDVWQKGVRLTLAREPNAPTWLEKQGRMVGAVKVKDTGKVVPFQRLDGAEVVDVALELPFASLPVPWRDRNRLAPDVPMPALKLPKLGTRFGAELVLIPKYASKIWKIGAVSASPDDVTRVRIRPGSSDEARKVRAQAFLHYDFGEISFFYQNAKEFLTVGREFWNGFGSGDEFLYVVMAPHELSRRESTVVARSEEILRVQGDLLERPIHDIEFRNLWFRHTTFNDPGLVGHHSVQAGLPWSPFLRAIPAAVSVSAAKGISFVGNRFENLGGSALSLYKGVDGAKIIGNRFVDIGASALEIGLVAAVERSSAIKDRRFLVQNVEVVNNSISKTGRASPGSPAVFVPQVRNMAFWHNEIASVPSYGIHMGYPDSSPDAYFLDHNRIKKNRFVANMQTLCDGGAIYTWLHQGRTKESALQIHENVVVGTKRWNGACDSPVSAVYFDQHSDYIDLFHNAFDDNVQAVKNGVPDDVFRNYGDFDWILKRDNGKEVDTVRRQAGLQDSSVKTGKGGHPVFSLEE